MAEQSAIEWTDATFNGWIGCTKVSPGCDNCYAEADFDLRKHRVTWGSGNPRSRTAPANWQKPLQWNDRPFYACSSCNWRGELAPGMRSALLRSGSCPSCSREARLTRRRVFCSSLSDVFDLEVPIEWLVDLLDVFRQTGNMDKLVLTKRVGNVRKRLNEASAAARHQQRHALANWIDEWAAGRPPVGIWLGATIVNREEMLRDGPKLRDTPARLHFWSVEPQLGCLGTIPAELVPGWVIVGGETGTKPRPFEVDWARAVLTQCRAAGVPVLVKQFGAHVLTSGISGPGQHWPRSTVLEDTGVGTFRVRLMHRKGADWAAWPEDLRMRQFPAP